MAAKELRNRPKEDIKRVYAKSKELESNPRPAGCKKLAGEKEDLRRLRAGDYRIIYTINDSIFIIDIHRIGHRRYLP